MAVQTKDEAEVLNESQKNTILPHEGEIHIPECDLTVN